MKLVSPISKLYTLRKCLLNTVPVSVKPSNEELRIQSSMGLQVSFGKTLSFTKLTVYLACTWPPPSSATKWQMIRYDIRWYISFINVLCGLLGLVFSVDKYRDNLFIAVQSACWVGSTANVLIKMIVFRINLKFVQTRIEEMEEFLKTARPHESVVLERYSARFSILQILICISNYLIASVVTFLPLLFQHQPLPSLAVYPFSVDSGVVRILVFIHQSIAAYQCASSVAAIDQAAVMMWFAGARLEILAAETKKILEAREFSDFVEKHENRLAYAVDASKSMRYIALASSMVSGLTATIGTLVLLSSQPLAEKMQFVLVPVMAGGAVFMCAWPAENLINVCHSLGNAVYNIAWFDMPVSTRKNLLIIIQRCQRPITVSIGGLLPTLTLQNYAAFLAAVYSYITTLRAVIPDREK